MRALALLLLPSLAAAQGRDPGIAAERFAPAPGPSALLSVEGADLPTFNHIAWALSVGHVARPIRIANRLDGRTISEPVAAITTVDAAVDLGLHPRLAVGLGVPLTLAARGDRLAGLGSGDERALAAPLLGDVRLRAKIALGAAPSRVRAAIVVVFTAPAGGERDFAATAGPTLEPRLVVQAELGPVTALANVGVRLAPERVLADVRFGDELTFGVGALGGPWRLRAVGELAGAVGERVRAIELRGALRLLLPAGFSLDAGAGAGLTRDATTPAWRVLLLVRQAI